MLTLVIYDSSDDRQRTKLAEYLKSYGLYRDQYSGFLGELNVHDKLILTKAVRKYVNGGHDSIYIIPLCDRCANTVKIVAEHGLTLKDTTAVTIVR
jgi:CRISPR-associated protein Cas2